ncbi:MAG: HemY protein [Granulosicoccus sp.]|jgi:HemY protein
MKRFFIFCCFLLVCVGFLVYQIQQDNSYFLIALGHTSIEVNLWFALGVLVVSIFLIWLCVAIVNGSIKRIYLTHQQFVGRSEKKYQGKATQGLIAFIEGDWPLAYRKLVRSAKYLPMPIINYLAASRCAHEMGEEQEAMQLLHQAEKCPGSNALAIALIQARMQVAGKQFEQALAILLRIEKNNPKHKGVLTLLKTVYVALKDWSALKRLLPRLHEENIGTLEDRYYLEQTLCQETVKDNVAKNAALSNEQREQLLEGCVNNLPTHFRKDSAILTLFIDTLIELKAFDNVGKVLAKNINREWNESWVRQYGLLPYSNSEAALMQAESWLKQKEDSAVLQLTLGRLCLQNKQWGRAKDFFVSGIGIKPMVEAYAELARLQNHLSEEDESQQSYKEGLVIAAGSLLCVSAFDT